MPRMLWPGCWALWAALAAVDDIVDSGAGHPAERAAGVQAWVSALDAELAAGTSTDMVRRALVDTIVRWGLDVADLRASFGVLAGDVHPAPLLTWDDWRARSRGMDSAWARQILVLLDRAGVDTSFAPRHGEAISRFLDGVQLIDDLADLPADLGQRPLTIPAEVLDRFPGAAEDLPRRRWTMPVQGVLAHLVGMARRWVDQPGLGAGWHPGPAILFATASRVFLARLDAIAAAGPGLLYASPEPGRITRWRLLAPARIRIALAWKLTTLAGPPAARPLPAPPGPAVRRLARSCPRGCARTASGPPGSPPTGYRGTSRSSWTATAAGPSSAACLVPRDTAPASRPCTTLSTAPWRSGCPT